MEWVRQQLEIKGLTQRALADALGITEQKLSHVFHGRRNIKAQEADCIRRFFGYVLPEDRPATIAVSGRVDANDRLVLVDSEAQEAGVFQIARPDWLPTEGVYAAQIDGSSAEPWALAGDIVFWQKNEGDVFIEDLGRPVIAETSDGQTVLKRLASGSSAGLWSLLSLNPTHPNLIDVELKWASRVMPPLPFDNVKVMP